MKLLNYYRGDSTTKNSDARFTQLKISKLKTISKLPGRENGIGTFVVTMTTFHE